MGTPTGAPKVPKGGAEGTTPPEGEGNPAEGGSSRVYHCLKKNIGLIVFFVVKYMVLIELYVVWISFSDV